MRKDGKWITETYHRHEFLGYGFGLGHEAVDQAVAPSEQEQKRLVVSIETRKR